MGPQQDAAHSTRKLQVMVSCSRCGKTGGKEQISGKGLSLVTLSYEEGMESGRVLVYCQECWIEMADCIAEVTPLEMVSPGVLLDLYRTGKTVSIRSLPASWFLAMRSLSWYERRGR